MRLFGPQASTSLVSQALPHSATGSAPTQAWAEVSVLE